MWVVLLLVQISVNSFDISEHGPLDVPPGTMMDWGEKLPPGWTQPDMPKGGWYDRMSKPGWEEWLRNEMATARET